MAGLMWCLSGLLDSVMMARRWAVPGSLIRFWVVEAALVVGSCSGARGGVSVAQGRALYS